MAKDTDAPAPQAQTLPIEYEEESQLPFLGFISIAMRWVEELITTISGFVLTVATGIGVVDLLSDGKLTADSPNIDLIYAISMAIGIGGQLVGLSARMSRMFSTGKWVQGALHIPVIALLAYVEYLAGVVYGFHKTFGDSVQVSLANLSIHERDFISDRTWVAVGLIILCGALRYQKKPKKSIEQIEAEEEFKRRKNEAQGKTQAAQLARFRGAITQTVGRKEEDKAVIIASQGASIEADQDGSNEASKAVAKPKIAVHLVTSNWHDKKAQWWDKKALQGWLKDVYNLDVSDDQCKKFILEAGTDNDGPTLKNGKGITYIALAKAARDHVKDPLRLDLITPNEEAPKGKAKAKITMLPRTDQDTDSMAANG